LDWKGKVELFEQIRREYEFGIGTIVGVALSSCKARAVIFNPRRSAISAAAAHNSSGSRSRDRWLLRNASNRAPSSSKS
jgi:hypothetical protein